MSELKAWRTPRILVASACALFATLLSWDARAGWQQDMVCGVPCPPSAPPVPQRAPNPPDDAADEQDRAGTRWRPLDPVAEAKRQEYRDAQDRLIQRNWVPISAMDIVSDPSGAVTVSQGSHLFNILPSDPISLTAPIAAVVNGTAIPTEALRRAVTILAAMQARLQGGLGGDEDAAFLASQAALALEGAPLRVKVSDAVGMNAAEIAAAAETLRPILVQLARHEADRKAAIAVKERTFEAYGELKKERTADDIDPPRNIEKHHALVVTYVKAKDEAGEAEKRVKEDAGKVAAVVATIHVLDP